MPYVVRLINDVLESFPMYVTVSLRTGHVTKQLFTM